MSSPFAEASTSDSAFTLPPRPYPGMRPFEANEWPLFFGRERMAEEVITGVLEQRLVVVHGDSGCGKSSLIRAGVLPRLQHKAARGGARWRTAAATPGGDPLWNLACALARLNEEHDVESGEEVVELRRLLNVGRKGAITIAQRIRHDAHDHVCVLLDQFEELFARENLFHQHEAALFIEFLVAVREERPPGLFVIATMRSEFTGACARFRGLAETVNAVQYLLPRMEHANLLRAIREPAALYNGEIELHLAEQLIADAGSSQDELPLIQHGLMLLYRDRVERAGATSSSWRLGLKDYANSGKGLADLLSNHADELAESARKTCVRPKDSDSNLEAIDDAAFARAIQGVFGALTDINAEGHAVRRPQSLAQLIAVTGSSESVVRNIADVFRTEGVSFVRPYGSASLELDDRVDISHEALIRCWQKIAKPLDGWLTQEFKNGLVWRSLLVQADSFERNSSNVLSPATTDERAAWIQSRSAPWSERYGAGWDRVQRLMKASLKERERQELIRRAGAALAFAAVVVAAIFFTGSAHQEAKVARGEAKERVLEAEKAERTLALLKPVLESAREESPPRVVDSKLNQDLHQMQQIIDDAQTSISEQVAKLPPPIIDNDRIWLIAGSKKHASEMANLRQELSSAGFNVTREMYLANQWLDEKPEVRYFNSVDKDQAERLADYLRVKLHADDLAAHPYKDPTARPGYIEIRLGL